SACSFRWHDFRPPQDFVRHPVADSGKSGLHQYHSFNWRLAVTIKESSEKLAVEFFGHDLRHSILPPARCRCAVMKLHASKLPRIGKNESPFPLIQYQVIVLLRAKIRGRDLHPSTHPEM